MLKKEDKIFKNLYNELGWEIDNSIKRDDWKNTKDLITRLIELQKRNAESFKRLIDTQSEKEKKSEFEKKPLKNLRIIKAYSSSMFNSSTRLN